MFRVAVLHLQQRAVAGRLRVDVLRAVGEMHGRVEGLEHAALESSSNTNELPTKRCSAGVSPRSRKPRPLTDGGSARANAASGVLRQTGSLPSRSQAGAVAYWR